MHPDRIRSRPPAPLAAAVGAALLLVTARFVLDSPPRKDPSPPAPVPGIAAPVATSPAPARASTVAPTPDPAPAPAPASARAPAPAPPSPAASSGAMVGIDPETGMLGMPSPEFRARASLSPALDRSMTGLTVVIRPDGSKHVDLQGRFQEYTVLRLTPDGREVEACVQGPDVDAALSKAAPAPAHELK